MQTDEHHIRQLVADWLAASKAGDIKKVLSLMSDDVVFLMPGRLPMHKEEFAAALRAQMGAQAPTMEATSEIQEIKVAGDWAFMWTKLTVVITPKEGATPITRAGNTLTVLRKDNGRWVIARDANMLTIQQN